MTDITRRRFLSVGVRSSLVLAGGIPVVSSRLAFGQANTSVRMRLEDFVTDPNRVQALRRSVQVMKQRAPSDPRSWFFQAAIHAVSSEWVQEALARDPKVAEVDQPRFWNQCPHFGQASADFLAWHRAYVYYFERILRDAAQDGSLSLPYWNYTDAAQRTFPRLFAISDPDPLTGQPRNSLFEPRREQAFMFGLYELAAGTVEVPDTETDFFGATEREGFAGGVADSDDETKGLIEQVPHDLLHFAIGGAIGFGTSSEPSSATDATVGLMASVETAAFDPIFWVHHANIDRLWSMWDCLAQRRWGAAPPQTWFKEKPWWFHDHDLTVHNLERAHYIERGRLGIRYDTDNAACQALSAQLPQPPPVGVALAAPPDRVPLTILRSQEVARSDSGVQLSASAPISQSVPITKSQILGSASLRSAIVTPPAAVQRRVVLQLDGIEYRGTPSVRYDVYLNVSPDTVPRRSDRRFVGTLALFGLARSTGGHGHGSGRQEFDITDLVRDPGFDLSTVNVIVVPDQLLKPRPGAPELRRDGGVTIRTMRIIAREGRTKPAP